MKTMLALCLVLVWSSIEFALRAQSASVPTALEVVSVKPNTSGDFRRAFRVEPGGRLVATNVTVRHVMWNAYRLQDFQIVGGPAWLGSDRYDITARAEGNPGPNELRTMMQALLADRFKLRAHFTTREMPVYALVLAKPGAIIGPRLRTSAGICASPGGTPANAPTGAQPAPRGGGTGGCGGFTVGTGVMSGKGVTLDRVASELTGLVGRPVTDRTGLAGAFDVDLEWSPDAQVDASDAPRNSANETAASIFTSVQEQLGLKLDSQRGPVEVLVIDAAERPVED